MTDPLSSDQLFIRKLREIVEANLSQEAFDVEELAREAGMSRSAVHRKLRNLGKQNASHFIREVRLLKAREMLGEGSLTASEVAYRTGFGSPAYFSKCYHEYYGYPPGEEKKRIPTDETERQKVVPVNTAIRMPAFGDAKTKRKVVFTLSALVLAVVSILVVMALGPRRKSSEMSIVVLPFKNLSADPGNQYLADGITEDILNSLCQVSDLRVISRTTSEHFRNTELTSGEISRNVNARNVLEGSVRRQGDRVRITVQLIDGQRERHLWSETYDRELTDMLGLQVEIARDVAEKLNAIITDSEAGQAAELPTANPKVWD